MGDSPEYCEIYEIRFTREQLIWLLRHLPMLREGQWPRQHNREVQPGYSPNKAHSGGFTKPAEVAAEIDARLSNCVIRHRGRRGVVRWVEDDGALLEQYYAYEIPLQDIARVKGTAPEWVAQHMNRALRFIKGSQRKMCDYEEWVRWGYCQCHRPTTMDGELRRILKAVS